MDITAHQETPAIFNIRKHLETACIPHDIEKYDENFNASSPDDYTCRLLCRRCHKREETFILELCARFFRRTVEQIYRKFS
ncbi:hypothetical protein RRG08_029916 [Elysia crispata]|uniref:Uncharacterized protein n=1 Tax=Elysia crispata TaxID=231223 RepID=A0AAE0ZJB2_9GAST|nr:hypothetical protein RRG08_029916 [Elysia crispata]